MRYKINGQQNEDNDLLELLIQELNDYLHTFDLVKIKITA